MPLEARKGERPGWSRIANMGFELAAAIGGFALVGYWVGRHYGHPKEGLAIGAVLGIIGGMYNLIRVSVVALRDDARASQKKSEE